MDEFNSAIEPLMAQSYETIFIGLSGGLDSCVLFHLLTQNAIIFPKLKAIHINHGLSPNAEHWQAQVEQLCLKNSISLEVFCLNLDIQSNIENVARDARYAIFERFLDSSKKCFVLAHHLNDHIETVLLRLMRGSGVDGLAGIPQWRALNKGQIYRPLLFLQRTALEAYANTHHLTWCEDESNQDTCYDRNFLRHEILPRLQSRWQGVNQTIKRASENCRKSQDLLESFLEKEFKTVVDEKEHLLISELLTNSEEFCIQMIRFWLKKKNIQSPSEAILHQIFRILSAKQDANPCVSLSNKKQIIEIRRYQNKLYAIFHADDRSSKTIFTNHHQNLTVRYRIGGETIRLHGQTKDLKKLFQTWGVPPWERDSVPLLYEGDRLVEVVGYAVAD